MHASGSLVVSTTFAKSHVSMVIDDAGLQALVALKKTEVWKNIYAYTQCYVFLFSVAVVAGKK